MRQARGLDHFGVNAEFGGELRRLFDAVFSEAAPHLGYLDRMLLARVEDVGLTGAYDLSNA